MKSELTQEELKRLLHYDPETGIFTWQIDAAKNIKKGTRAGTINNHGYVQIRVNGIIYKSSRLAFLYMDGFFPEHISEHKNRVRHDNRWVNLRHATQSCNMQNQSVYKNNISGYPGISWNVYHQKWICRLVVRRKEFFLGYYIDPLEAALARYTFEVWCPLWTCNHNSELAKAIREAWPEFRF